MQEKTYRFRFLLSITFCATLFAGRAFAQETAPASEIVDKLKAIPGVVEVTPARPGRNGAAARDTYEVMIEQPLDHTNPAAGTFRQRFFVAHSDYSKPVLLGTEGYAANGVGGGELQRMLGGNQVTVEHRYFGRSTPSPVDWKYLTVKNAADDMHVIVSAMKKIYPGKWVSTGASKGGQTSLFYKCYYPQDVDAVVAYVAPVNVTQEDPRINIFINSVGDEATRTKIKAYQIALFKREDELLPLVQAEADRRNWTFKMGFAKAYEYGVLEYPYAFWQYGADPKAVPAADATAQELAANYNRVGTLRYYSDQGMKQFEPFLYQAFTEIGYYNYDITDFKEYMKANPNPTNLDICPEGAKIVFNPATMAFVFHTLQYEANNVIYIYGDLDAWSSTQMQLLGRTNAIKFVVKDAHHGTGVRQFTPEQKELFYSTMDKWLDLKLNRN